MKYCLAACIVAISIIIGIIHISPPYLSTECVLFKVNCPIIESKIVTQRSMRNNMNFDLIGKTINDWIETGEEIASQINIRMKGKEVFSFYSADNIATNYNFDDVSLCSIFSNTKTFASLLIGIAIDKKWIDSYNDPITKYWRHFPTNRGKYNLKIKDILRHEGGLCVYKKYRIVYDLRNINIATYDIIKKAIEDEEIIYYDGYKRCYHTISRGHILNEIFHSVEPNGRYMAQYYEQKILPKLLKNDKKFGLTFRGLRYVKYFNDERVFNKERSFDVESAGFLWSLYHIKFAKYILKRPIISDDTLNNKICKYLNDSSLCPKQDMNINKRIFYMALDNVNEMHETNDYRPKQLSQYNRNMVMEHMSSMGLGNAHSMTKTYEFILNKVISKETKELMFSEIDTKFDIALGVNTSFTIGGFGHFQWNNIEWYGWMGWGGSLMIYSPKYDCFIAYTINGFTRENYMADPRISVIVNLISQQLLK